MQGNNSGNQGNQNNTSKQSGLSWSQPSSVTKPSQTGTTSNAKSTPLLKPAVVTSPAPSSRKTMMLFAGGVVVGGLLAWSWFSLMPGEVGDDNVATPAGVEGGTEASGATTTDGATDGSSNTTAGSQALVVPPTQDAGRSVTITSAAVTVPTWIAVYDYKNGKRGNALGAALFFPNGTRNSIKLLRATVPGETYAVGRHIDNGDGKFSVRGDTPVMSAAGQPIYVEFKAQ